MKKLANLKGVKTLNKIDQKSINGGFTFTTFCVCIGISPDGFLVISDISCSNGVCPQGFTPTYL